MSNSKTLVLNNEQIQAKLDRMVHEIHELCYSETEIIICGVAPGNGIEISNRIGYLNGKDVAIIAGSTSGTDAAAHPTNMKGNAYDGFNGYTFNSGKGYANTVYSHANFLAGKKINLFGKVLKAITAVQAMYDSVTKKRSEYYEYNQAS